MSEKLARLLQDKKAIILEDWENAVRAAISVARLESPSALRNSIPVFLDELAIALTNGLSAIKPQIIKFAHKHGSERANLSEYSIEDALSEYNILRKIIFKVLEQESWVSSSERDIIYEAIHFGMMKAGAEYAKLQMNEATELSQRLKRITDIQPSLIGQIDRNLRYQFVNQTYEAWFDHPLDDFIGKTVEEVVGLEAYEVMKPHFDQAFKGHKVVFETDITYQNGDTKFIHSTFSPGFNETGEVNTVYISVTDISEQRKILDAFEKEQILRDKFISALSHDLRTPLTTASISAQMIQRKSSEPNLTNLAGKITASLKRVDKMIEDLLDANSLRAGKKIVPELMEMNIVDLVKATLNELETIYGDRFILDSQEEIITYLSPNGIRRVLENLCTNAIKYGSDTAPVSVYLTKERFFLNIGVHNFGTSLKGSNTTSLFEEFVRTSSAEKSGKKGWGIGLSIVKGVIEAHGGMVDIENDDYGTLFKIKLPLDARAFVYSIKEIEAHQRNALAQPF